MENFPINPMDLAVIVIVLLAALLALTRGLVAEVLSLGAWVLAALAAMYGLPYVLPYAKELIKFEMAAYGASAIAVFLVALVILTMAGNALSRRVRDSSLSAIDRSLGFAFGLVKGAVLASLAWLFIVWLIPQAEHPDWMREARTRPMLDTGAGAIYELVPENLRAEGLAHVDFARDRAQRAIEAKQALDRLAAPVPAAPSTGVGTTGAGTGATGAPTNVTNTDNGYKSGERGDLDRLIRTTQ